MTFYHFFNRLCYLLFGLLFVAVWANAELSTMSDGDLRLTSGQSLLAVTKPANVNGISFYKLGIGVKVEVNANISALRLGCDGINGAGGCDISIDNLSIAGPGGGPDSDARLSNPFLEFAIANDNSPATREIVGFRLGGLMESALMQFGRNCTGTENVGCSGSNYQGPNGINSFSGYMPIAATSGSGVTASQQICTGSFCGGGAINLGINMLAKIKVTNVPFLGTTTGDYQSSGYIMTVQPANVNFSTNAFNVYGKRMNSVNVTGYVNSFAANFTGQATGTTTALGQSQSSTNAMSGSMSNARVSNVQISENLGYMHSTPINNNPFYLSLQKQDLLWEGESVAAYRGWFMAFKNSISLPNMNAGSSVALNDVNVLRNTMNKINEYLNKTPPVIQMDYNNPNDPLPPINVDFLSSRIGSGNNLTDGGSGANSLSLQNIVLSNQNIIPNCYGRTFC